ncbi:MAG: type II secretion system protein N [Inhella sp.]
MRRILGSNPRSGALLAGALLIGLGLALGLGGSNPGGESPHVAQPVAEPLTAPVALPAAVPAAELRAAPPEVLRFELEALRRGASGRPLALIRQGGAPARVLGVGESLGLGVRLAQIEPRAVWIERSGQRERLELPREAAALPALPPPSPPRLDEALGPIARPADAPLPSSTGLERAIRRAQGAAVRS